MRKRFEASKETYALVGFFREMKLEEQVSYHDISKVIGFEVTPAISSNARIIAQRDHDVYIGIIRGFGFFRGTHAMATDSLPEYARKAKRTAKRGKQRAAFALKGNLTQEKHRQASEWYSRFSIIEDTTGSIPMAKTNRQRPESIEEAPKFDYRTALDRINS